MTNWQTDSDRIWSVALDSAHLLQSTFGCSAEGSTASGFAIALAVLFK